MVHDLVSSHFMAWHVGFNSRNFMFYLECECEFVEHDHCICT